MRGRRREVCGGGGGFGGVGEGEVGGAYDAVGGFKERGFEDGGEFADVAGPGVLDEASERAGAEDDGALLVAGAEAVKQALGERGDVFAALAERRDGEADGGEAEGEVGDEQSLAGHLAERGVGGGEQDGAAGRAVLKGLEDAEQEALSGRGEQVNAVEVGEAGEGGGIGVGDQPLAGVVALEGGVGEEGAGEEVAGEGVLADAGFAFEGGDLEVGCGHVGLHDEFAPGAADADDLECGEGVDFQQGEAGDGGAGLELSGAQRCQGASPPWLLGAVPGQQRMYRRGEEKHERESCVDLSRSCCGIWWICGRLAEALGGFVGEDLAVADVDDAVGVLGDVGLVGDEDDGVALGVKSVKEGHDLDAGFGVEVAGGLVGEDDGGAS